MNRLKGLEQLFNETGYETKIEICSDDVKEYSRLSVLNGETVITCFFFSLDGTVMYDLDDLKRLRNK